ncbi:MAG TPA: hypothetical protein VN238_03700 [Solirubrobacteraceae bacterium]|nr:hypothetical protein [Solirubrobacteraceae bacterium]
MHQEHVTTSQTVRIRSFRIVFALERRLFKIDRFRLPFAYGLPLRSLAYAAAAVVAVAAAGSLPVAGAAVGAVPPPLRFVIAPVLISAAMTRLRIDGLPAHKAARLWAIHAIAPSLTVGFRPVRVSAVDRISDPLVLVADPHAPALRPAVIRDARQIAVRVPARASADGQTLTLTQTPGPALRQPKRIRVAAGARVRIR